MLARSLEGVLLVAVIVAVWLVMVLPVVIYFLVSVVRGCLILNSKSLVLCHTYAATEYRIHR